MKEEQRALLPAGWEVLFIANTFTTVPEPMGGTKHFVEFANNWSRAGQSLKVMTPRTGAENCKLEGYCGPFIEVRPSCVVRFGRYIGRSGEERSIWAVRLGIMGMFLIWGISALLYLPWKATALLLYGTSHMLPDVLPAFIQKVLRRRPTFWVVVVHHLILPPSTRPGNDFSNWVSYLAQSASLHLIRRACDFVVVDNEIIAKEIEGMGFPGDKIYVTRMGTDLPGIERPERPEYEGCFLGRLHPSKGIYELVDIWRRVCDQKPGSRLAVVGSGPEPIRDELEKQFLEEGLGDQVKLLGYLPREELDRVLASSRVFLLPSHEEGFGISILEAMAQGLPAVAYSLPPFSGIYGDALTTVPIGDTESFALKVLELLTDKGIWKEKSGESHEFAEQYSWKRVSLEQAEAIADALRDARASAGPKGENPER